ncbi:MAG: glutamate--tRNA ligase, partial [Roseinatronobacter sp.]|nr:glutamate--tRNA ligase [Roseinatronobacter sp.]
LSKRHGALGVEEYQRMGYPAAAMRNYLARLGWSHGNDEFFTDSQALEWFDISGIGKSPARLDFKKLDHLTAQHMSVADDAALLHELQAYLAATGADPLTQAQYAGMLKAMPFVKDKAKSFGQIYEKAYFILTERPISLDEKAAAALDTVSRSILRELTPRLQNATWEREFLEGIVTEIAQAHGLGLGKLAQPLRAALAGRTSSPSIFDMMMTLGKAESLGRIEDAAT